MNIKELEYFRAVCRLKSITKAAHSLYMTPQGLSKIIKNLENELGATLLNRKASGISLTASGEYLYEHLGDVLSPYEKMCSEIRCIEQQERHEIDLLSAYGILRLVTPECIGDFRNRYPQITFHYREFPDRQVERMFQAGEGNVAFTVGDSSRKFMEATFMEQFEIKLLVNRSHPLAKKESVTIRDIEGERLYIESSEFHIHQLIVEKCRQAGFEPNIVFETSGFSLCHKMVQQNKGISVTVDFIFDDMGHENLVMLPFEDGPFYWSTYMLTRKGSTLNPDIQLFHQHVMGWLRKIKEKHIPR